MSTRINNKISLNSQKHLRKSQKKRKLSQEFIFSFSQENIEEDKENMATQKFNKISIDKTQKRNALEDVTNIQNEEISLCRSLDFWFDSDKTNTKTENKFTQNLKNDDLLQVLETDLIPKSNVKISTETNILKLLKYCPQSENRFITNCFEKFHSKNDKTKLKSAMTHWSYRPKITHKNKDNLEDNVLKEWINSLISAYNYQKFSAKATSIYLMSENRTLLFKKCQNQKSATVVLNSVGTLIKQKLKEENIKFFDFRQNCEKENLKNRDLDNFEQNGGKIKRKNFFQTDEKLDLECAVIKGKTDVHSIFDLLLNFTKALFFDLPQIYCNFPFANAKFESLKRKITKTVLKTNKTRYTLQLDGICFPENLAEIAKIIKREDKKSSIKIKSTPFPKSENLNIAILDNFTDPKYEQILTKFDLQKNEVENFIKNGFSKNFAQNRFSEFIEFGERKINF
ncbi:hypothetical protein MHBO_000273 [Bonamia ostreae]|uniref:Uncharacterized protein n=1 Tax=Bonamia ostreae TaxID=126728 RepID=A0ABV2AF50_9EUKA